MFASILLSLFLLFSPQTDKKEQAKTFAVKGFQKIEQKEYKSAVKTFEKAIKLDKNCKEAHLGKGVAYYKWGDYNKRKIYPEEFIKRALKIDPDYIDAKIHLGWCYYFKRKEKDAIEHFNTILFEDTPSAELYFKAALFFDNLENVHQKEKEKVFTLLRIAEEMNYEKPELYYKLGWKYFLRDSVNTALEKYLQGIKTDDNTNFQSYLDIAVIYYNQYNHFDALKYFNMAFKNIPAHLKKLFIDISGDSKSQLRDYVLAATAIKYYLDDNGKLNDKGKAYLKEGTIFYKTGNITENVFMAILSRSEKENYKKLDILSERERYKRKYFIKHNLTPFQPENKVLEEFNRRCKYILDVYKARTPYGFDDRGKIYLKYGEPEIKKIYYEGVYYVEEWLYPRLHVNYMIFIFVGKPTLIPCELMENRNEFRSKIGYVPKAGAGLPEYPKAEQIQEQVIFTVFRKELLEEKLVTDYPFIRHKEKHLNFGFRVSDFKRAGKKSYSEIYYGVNLKNLEFVKTENRYFSTIRFYTSLSDSNANMIIKDSVDYSYYTEDKNSEGTAINQLEYSLPSGSYTIFVKMRNPEGKKTGIYSDEIFVDDYSKSVLKLSDLQFSFDISTAKPGDKYVKNGLKITPYPFFEVSRSKPVFIYYETYNLSVDNRAKTRYEIFYDIKLLESKESVFRKLFSGKGFKESISFGKKEYGSFSNTFDYTSFDFSKLRLGKYELTVKVKDRLTGNETEKSDTFILVK